MPKTKYFISPENKQMNYHQITTCGFKYQHAPLPPSKKGNLSIKFNSIIISICDLIFGHEGYSSPSTSLNFEV